MNDQLAIDFKAARARADVGIQQAADAAEARSPGWIEVAAEALRDFYREQRIPQTVEAARVLLTPRIPAPSDLRAWGGATRRALRLGFIEWSGDFAPVASSHLSAKKTYRAGPQA